jgi:hypothetical protein
MFGQGEGGRGTDFPEFDDDWKVVRVEVLRHGSSWQY